MTITINIYSVKKSSRAASARARRGAQFGDIFHAHLSLERDEEMWFFGGITKTEIGKLFNLEHSVRGKKKNKQNKW